MRCPDPRSRDISDPEGVVCFLQVSLYIVEPSPLRRAASLSSSALCNLAEDGCAGDLLSEDDGRSAFDDEFEEVGGEVASVVSAELLSCDAERLTRRRSGPDRPVGGPPGELEREGPSADPGKEVNLSVPHQVGRFDVKD